MGLIKLATVHCFNHKSEFEHCLFIPLKNYTYLSLEQLQNDSYDLQQKPKSFVQFKTHPRIFVWYTNKEINTFYKMHLFNFNHF